MVLDSGQFTDWAALGCLAKWFTWKGKERKLLLANETATKSALRQLINCFWPYLRTRNLFQGEINTECYTPPLCPDDLHLNAKVRRPPPHNQSKLIQLMTVLVSPTLSVASPLNFVDIPQKINSMMQSFVALSRNMFNSLKPTAGELLKASQPPEDNTE